MKGVLMMLLKTSPRDQCFKTWSYTIMGHEIQWVVTGIFYLKQRKEQNLDSIIVKYITHGKVYF